MRRRLHAAGGGVVSRRPPPALYLPYPSAVVYGPPARYLAAALKAGGHLRVWLDDHAVPAELRGAVLDALEALAAAGRAWEAGRHAGPGGGCGTASGVAGAASGSARSRPSEEIVVADAARMLGVSPQRVRQIAGSRLGGRKVGGRWLLSRAAVLAYLAARDAA